MLMAMAPMHKDMHEWASSKHQEWQDRRQMCAVPDDEITADDNGETQHGPASVGPEAAEHDHPPS